MNGLENSEICVNMVFRVAISKFGIPLAKIAIHSHFSSMKITQDVREYAKEQNVEAEKALAVGMAEKAKEFVATGSEIYS
jgi:hypothetical protein